MSVNVCVPVLKRYDLLRELLLSLHASTLMPETVWIIDNGRDHVRLATAVAASPVPTMVHRPPLPMGVAESWNWFVRHVGEERVIANDDIAFAPDSLRRLVDTPGGFVSALPGSNACSCFLLRDSCVRKVGLFDETISPGYAYFEDCDYVERMIAERERIVPCDAGVRHALSQTVAAYTDEEMTDHHRRFRLAEANFHRKWGRGPDLSRKVDYDG